MNWKRTVLKKSDIYAIIDTKLFPPKSFSRRIRSLLKNNVKIFQLRDKYSDLKTIIRYAFRLKKLIKNKGLLIINDHAHVALICDADGLHIGQKDISIELARKILGQDKIIGVSANNLTQAIRAQDNKADYIGCGSLFETKTKLDKTIIDKKIINHLIKKISIPLFFIGGITPDRLRLLKDYKIKRIAVCRALATSKNIDKTIFEFRKALKEINLSNNTR